MNKLCTVENCGKKVHSKGMCRTHYQRFKRHGTIDVKVNGLIHGVGINDMPYGWASENEYNTAIYNKWRSMIKRCYDKKTHITHKCYENATVCDKWIHLSGFVEDIVYIKGYDKWIESKYKLALDKDIKGSDVKHYCLDNCSFMSNTENSQKIESSIYNKSIICVETGVVYNSIKDASEKTNIKRANISCVLTGKSKSAGGYKWKYIE